MMAEEKQYVGPNDALGKDGKVVPGDAVEISKRQLKMIEDSYGTVYGKPTGYKVYAGWGAGTLRARVKDGDVLSEKEVPIPEGHDRKTIIKELVQNGNLIPQYAKEPEAEAAEADEEAAAEAEAEPATDDTDDDTEEA